MSKPSAIPWSASGKFRNVADDHITRLTDKRDMNMYQWQMGPEYYLKNPIHISSHVTLFHFAIMIQICIPFKLLCNTNLPHSIYEYASDGIHTKK